MVEIKKKIHWQYVNYSAIAGIILGITALGFLIGRDSSFVMGVDKNVVTLTATPTPKKVLLPTSIPKTTEKRNIQYNSQVPNNTESYENSQQEQAPSTNQTMIACTLSQGMYQMTQAQCNEMQAYDKPVQSSNTAPVYIPNPPPIDTYVPEPPIQNNNDQLYAQCVTNAQQTYNQSVQRNLNMYGSRGVGEGLNQIASQEQQQAISQCDSQYPRQ